MFKAYGLDPFPLLVPVILSWGSFLEQGAKRKHCHILKTAHTLFLKVFLPPHFRVNTVSNIVYLINLQPSFHLHSRSPGECLNGTLPRTDYLRIFSYRCFVLLSPREWTKFTTQSISCIFLGIPLSINIIVIIILLLIVFASPVIPRLITPPLFILILFPQSLSFPRSLCLSFFLPLPLKMLPLCYLLLHHLTLLPSFSLTSFLFCLLSLPQCLPLLPCYFLLT